ncbi:alpha/beta hydrolase-fold protein [Lysobacter yangpyeongensis]|uniref:Acyl-CoA:diacylglycerol acyltransferase n=1 Tax=Lysobacter yangpyeongensis TaxID=346182 RepID=A0ABW0SMQ2_9GAMM
MTSFLHRPFRRALFRAAQLLVLAALLSACAHHAPGAVAPAHGPLVVDSFGIAAPGVAPAPLHVRVWLPPAYGAAAARRYPVLYVNDGQDMEAVGLQATLERLYAEDTIRPLIVVAIDMPPDRMAAYGFSDRVAGRSLVAATRYGPVGANAHAYSQWLAQTLVPEIDRRYRTRPSADARAVLGWSLGAANAFNLGWQYPELFGRVGAFSPSLWLAADGSDARAVQRTRLAQRMVDATSPRNGARYFFAVGTAEEKDDRDGDGIVDVLDDTRDLLLGWKDGDELRAKGLQQLGYSVNTDYGAHPDRCDSVLLTLDGGAHNQASWARMLPAFLTWAYARRAPALEATGRVDSWQDVESAYVPARNVDVWLPPGYAEHPHRRYPVVYMHDGQNLFDPRLSYTGVDWGIDETMTRLIAEHRVREAIVVGIWNTPRRLQEYMPRKAVKGESLAVGVEGFPPLARTDITSDDYLRFLVEELKPFIDATYRTRRGRSDTVVMGSSMGGLISLYAVAEYPDVFGGVGAISTHWPIGDGAMIDWLSTHLPDPRRHRIYYDFGTATLDAQYAPYQQRMDAAMRANGHVEGRDWITRRFEGAEHSERAWRERVDVPLVFLLGK